MTTEMATTCPHCGAELVLSDQRATMTCRYDGPIRDATPEERDDG